MMRLSLFCLVLFLGAPLAAAAQSAGALLPPETAPEDRLTITTTSGEQVSGRLVADRDGSLTLRANQQNRTIAHGDIAHVRKYHNRFLFGPIIGLGAGLAAGIYPRLLLENEGANGDVVLAWTIGIGVGVGSLIDLVNGSDRTIYSRIAGVVGRLQVQPGVRGARLVWSTTW